MMSRTKKRNPFAQEPNLLIQVPLTQGRFTPFLPIDVHPDVYTLKHKERLADNQCREGLFLHEPLAEEGKPSAQSHEVNWRLQK